MSIFLLNVNMEVLGGSGEDCHLILNSDYNGKKACVIGVFDGLGGRSAGFDGLKGGQIASKEASQITQTILSQWHCRLNEKIAYQIQSTVCQSLKSQADAKMPKSRLSGTLAGKRLCTTIALASVSEREEGIHDINLAWMGDSRIYFLSPSQGLQQLTVDDLDVRKDAFEMIREDPPMSQYLTADIPSNWRIHHDCETIEEHGCVFVCTDGCFQYLSSPWEFEILLIQTLMNANSPAEWETLLVEKYNQIKQDDVSLLLCPLGFTSFEHLKESYISRHEELVSVYECVSKDIGSLRQLWDIYRHKYEARLKINVGVINEEKPVQPQSDPGLSSERYKVPKVDSSGSQSLLPQTSDPTLVSIEKERKKLQIPELPMLWSTDRISNHKLHTPDVANQVSSLLKEAREYHFSEPHTAIQWYRKILNLDPNHIDSLLAVSVLYLDTKSPLKAIDCLQKLLYLPSFMHAEVAKKYLAEAYYKSNQHYNAVNVFKELYPNLNKSELGMYAKSLMEESRLEEATSICESIIDKNPDDAYAFFLIGHIHHKQNILEKAEEFLGWSRRLYQDIYDKTRSKTDCKNLQSVEREYKEVRRKRNQTSIDYHGGI